MATVLGDQESTGKGSTRAQVLSFTSTLYLTTKLATYIIFNCIKPTGSATCIERDIQLSLSLSLFSSLYVAHICYTDLLCMSSLLETGHQTLVTRPPALPCGCVPQLPTCFGDAQHALLHMPACQAARTFKCVCVNCHTCIQCIYVYVLEAQFYVYLTDDSRPIQKWIVQSISEFSFHSVFRTM